MSGFLVQALILQMRNLKSNVVHNEDWLLEMKKLLWLSELWSVVFSSGMLDLLYLCNFSNC